MVATSRLLAAATLVLAGIGSASAGDTFISATVGGVLAPGVYGQINVGSAPPPPVLYPQPVVVEQQPVYGAPPRPVYLYVPPGHAKNWKKHCRKYDACHRPVYFAHVDNDGRYVRGGRDERRHDRDHDRGDDHHHGHGHGHGRGHGRD